MKIKNIKKHLIILLVLILTISSTLFILVTKSNQNKITNSQIENDIKVSVIVPVYNTEKYIRECMDSIINQTLKDIEIICVDDGSPDNSGKILDEYAQKDNRIHVIHQKNAGVSAARNRGIAEAKGEYIKFVDSDDFISNETCQICYDKSKEYDADIVVHDVEENNVLNKPQFDRITMSSCFILFKADLIKNNNIKFREGTSYGEDQAFNLICVPKANKIVTIVDNLYTYRANPTSATNTSNTIKHSFSHAENVKYVYNDWKYNGYFNNETAKINFLKWFCDMNYWIGSNRDIDKLFVSSIGKELLDTKVLNLLPNNYKQSIQKMINNANQS